MGPPSRLGDLVRGLGHGCELVMAEEGGRLGGRATGALRRGVSRTEQIVGQVAIERRLGSGRRGRLLDVSPELADLLGGAIDLGTQPGKRLVERRCAPLDEVELAELVGHVREDRADRGHEALLHVRHE
jgi:hypothetical protein